MFVRSYFKLTINEMIIADSDNIFKYLNFLKILRFKAMNPPTKKNKAQSKKA